MSEPGTIESTSDDRILAALAYLFGIIGALIIWAVRRDKSKFVNFHALQAIAFEALVMVASFVLSFCLVGAMFAGMALTMVLAVQQSSNSDAIAPFFLLPTFFPFGMMACLMPFMLVFLGIRLFAAISVATGRDLHFPWLGKKVEEFLAK